ncbi:hypothetical protein JOD55_000285 [Arcanobacterium pluranimalium]|uniref:hypothetical protein n=1 Tax=Arcanobacterium pluranimalium TaxID=108028 RepID=UPI0019587765|nr:hypothetical protein [Arcanobacterium pluranimalium]MBM7824458.1 hypothetical protein [Arcanobacterium pluranimalium]
MSEELAFAGKRIADRFELTAPTPYSFGAEHTATWFANDTVLSRQVRAIAVDIHHPHREAVIDAARRSSLIDDTHTIAVVSVVDNATDAVILTELPLGTPLSAYLNGDPLDPQLVSSIMGQLASTIHNASQRGVRHLQLAANKIYLTDSGDILIDGLGVSAALAGVDTNRLSAELDRDEARGLVVMLAALLHGQDFPSDPSTHDSLIASARDIPELPQELADLFAKENSDKPIRAAGDFMRMIMPWEEIDFSKLPTPRSSDDPALPQLADDSELSDNELTDTSIFAAQFAEDNDLVEQPQLSSQPVWPTLARPVQAPTPEQPPVSDPVDAAWPVESTDAESTDTAATATDIEPVKDSLVSESTAEEPATAMLAAGESTSVEPTSAEQEGVEPPAESQSAEQKLSEQKSAESSSEKPEFIKALSQKTSALPKLAWPKLPETTESQASALFENSTPVEVPERTSILESLRETMAPSSYAYEQRKSDRNAASRTTLDADAKASAGVAAASSSLGSSPNSSTKGSAASSSSAPTTSEKRDGAGVVLDKKFNAPKAVFIIFGILAAIGLIFAFSQLFKPLDPVSVTKPDSEKQTSQKDSSKDGNSGDSSEKDSANKDAEATAVAPKIVKVTTVAQNPSFLADQDDSTKRLVSTTNLAFDGNPATAWQSWWFKNAATYNKNKLGLHIELEKETAVSEINLNIAGEGGDVRWIKATAANPTQGDAVANSAMNAQTTLKASAPVTTKELVIWFDALPVDKEGKLRVVVNEISIK